MFADFSLSSIKRCHRHRRFGGFIFLLPILAALVVTLVAVHESTSTGTMGRILIDLQQADEEQFHQSNGVVHIHNDESTPVTVAAAAGASDAASINKSNWETNDNRPWFVMHVGPPKTAVRLHCLFVC